MDFTLNKYYNLLISFKNKGYSFSSFQKYLIDKPNGKTVILRHDVDELAGNALSMARIENSLGINATYYFRKVRQSDKSDIIREIANLGAEIGYHYEDLSFANGNVDEAIKSFKNNLAYFRTYYPIKTVCMHGSSSSKYDNRDIWKTCNLEEFGLIGEPYLSLDFNKVYYITDTGYAWDGGKYAVRDLVESPFKQKYHSTDNIIQAVESGEFPEQAMMLAHTLWTDSRSQWLYLHIREYFRNRVKSVSKKSPIVKKMYSGLVKAYWRK